MSFTPYKTNNALSLESIVKVAIAKIAYFAYLQLPSMQSYSRVTFTLLQNHKRKARFSITTNYEFLNSKLQGISSTSMRVLRFHGYIRLSWIEFICLPHTLTIDLVLHFHGMVVWSCPLICTRQWKIEDISRSQKMWRKNCNTTF